MVMPRVPIQRVSGYPGMLELSNATRWVSGEASYLECREGIHSPQSPPVGAAEGFKLVSFELREQQCFGDLDHSTQVPLRGACTKCGTPPTVYPNTFRSAKSAGSKGMARGSG